MKSIKTKIYLFVLMIVMSANAYSTHYVGYDMNMIGLGNNMYRIRLKCYRDVTGAGFPTTETLTIYRNGDNASIQTISLPRVQQYNITYDPKDCPPPGADLKLEMHIYESAPVNLSALNAAAGYYLAGGTCCRNPGVTNVLNSSSAGILFTMEFPRLNTASPYVNNSSPEFKKAPLAFYCVGKPYTLDWEVSDANGDSLVFSLAQPLDDGNTKPHNLIDWAPGYNLAYNILDGVPDLTINPRTGIINFIPTRTGRYLVAFKCEEFRNGVKIGEIRREFQLETVLCPEAPPVTEDNNNQKRSIVDTIYYNEDFKLTFTSRDSPLDSLFMFILPNISPGENLLDPNTFQAKWGKAGIPLGGQDARNLVIDGQGSVIGEFNWKPKCDHVRNKPYNFTVVVRDKTCPSPFYDSTFVTLYVVKKDNVDPFFILPDTIKSKVSNETVLRYFVNAGERFQLASDSILRTYDQDSSQVVTISYNPDPANGAVNSAFIFSSTPSLINSTAAFIWQTSCLDQRDEPYKVEFVATDNDCKSPSSARFSIEIYIKDQPNLKPVFDASLPSTFSVAEGTTDSFSIVIRDIYNLATNRYKQITLYPDLTDFAAVPGGAMPIIDTTTSNDSMRVAFIWSPVCANVRLEPYRLTLRTSDEGCPTITTTKEVLVYATGPFNSAPEFRTPTNVKYNVVDTSIYGGDNFLYNLYAVDTNMRFDSVFIALDASSEISNATLVKNIAELIPVEGKDSARTVLRWQSDCLDIRSTPYVAYVIARDNECVNPERDTLVFNITVLERPNFVPQFTAATMANILPTYVLPATTVLEIPLSAYDTLTGEIITLDTVYSNIPQGYPRPEIIRASGLGKDTISTVLRWVLDCALIRDEPYTIKIAAWDEACRNPQDSAGYTFTVKVTTNPDLNPVFNVAKDSLIELVAGETYELELIASSVNPGDSIRISTLGDVYNLPSSSATFEQTEVAGTGKAMFKWTVGCDQISDNIYTAKFVTGNYPCKSDADTLTLTFKVIPNTDITNEIPNVFSPNGDGKNDTYSIINQYKVYCDPGFKFSIFNRWGKKVFESVDPEFVWDPKESQAAGTYFFTLESRARTQTGTIEIVK
jgi:gliding motility-associated-like protein